MKAAIFLCLLFQVAGALWGQPPSTEIDSLRVEGKALFQGKPLPLKTAFAQWHTKKSMLSIFLFPFDITQEDLAIYKKRFDYRDLKKPSPDPSRWQWVPWVWIDIIFRPDAALSMENMKGANLAFVNFDFDGSSVTKSGDAFLLYKQFSAFSATGTNIGDSVEFSLKSIDDTEFHEFEIQLQGKTKILAQPPF